MPRIRIMAVAAVLLCATAFAYSWWLLRGQGPSLGAQNQANLGPGVIVGAPVGGSFTLVDQYGREVSDASFRGRYLLVFFGFTHCPDVCPTTLDRFARVLELLGPDAAKVQALFISVDPERDTPEVVRDYVQLFDSRILGLTGRADQVEAAAKAYRVFYARATSDKAPGDYQVDHSAFEYLMGPDGKNLYIFTPEVSPERMVELIREHL